MTGQLTPRTRNVVCIMLTTLPIAVPAAPPCAPRLFSADGGTAVSDSAECPEPAPGSDTPNYDDPLATCSGFAARRTVSVASATALQQVLADANCGDTLQLAPATYHGGFSTDKSCPATSPIIVQGAPNYQSILTGNFTLNGQHTIVTGVRFDGENGRVLLGGMNNKVLANRFSGWTWFAVTMVTGTKGEIAYNDFSEPHGWESENDSGIPLRMGIRTTEKDPSSFHFDAWVHHNHFHDFPPKPDNRNYHSGQSDAMEVCVTGRAATASMLTGWYIESNLIARHRQGHGVIDLKCGGNVVRYNTVTESPQGRIDVRNGSYNVLESNWIEGGSVIHGGYNKIIGNYVRGAGISVVAGEYEWDEANTKHSRAFKVLVAGNNTTALHIGDPSSEAAQYPALDTVVEAHAGSKPVLDRETNTIVRATTNAKFLAPVKLNPNEVGPAAMSRASSSYLACRHP
jgi:hypothetical protein